MFDINALTDDQYLNIFGVPRNPPLPAPFAPWKQPFNSYELASYTQARCLVKKLNVLLINFGVGDPRPMGGGVLDGDDEAIQNAKDSANSPMEASTGVYMPAWTSADTAKPLQMTDNDGVLYLPLCMRFKNGHSGLNVGLVLDELSRMPRSSQYVLRSLASEVEGSIR